MKTCTRDETWVPHFNPDSKAESRQWKHPASPPHGKCRVVRSAGKGMVTLFWDADGVLLVDFLEKRRTINNEYCASILEQLQRQSSKRDVERCQKVSACSKTTHRRTRAG